MLRGAEDASAMFAKVKSSKQWEERLNGETIENRSVLQGLFEEHQYHATIAKEQGKRAIRCSAPFFCFVANLYEGMTSGRYEFMAQVFNLPCGRTVRRWLQDISSGDTAVNGAILFENIDKMATLIGKRYGQIPLRDPR